MCQKLPFRFLLELSKLNPESLAAIPTSNNTPPWSQAMPYDEIDLEAIAAEMDKLLDEHFGEQAERRRFIKRSRKLSANDQHLIYSLLTKSIKSDEMQARYQSMDDPVRVGHTLLLLETELQKTKNLVLLEFIAVLLEQPGFIHTMDRLRYPLWEMNSLLENRILPEECIRAIWSHRKDEFLAMDEYNLPTRLLVRARNCPGDILEETLVIKDPSVRGAIAKHRNLNDSILHFYLNSPRKPERLELARSRFVPPEILLSLMRDKHDSVIKYAKINFNKRFPDVEITEAAIDEAVQKYIDKPFVPSRKPIKAFDPYSEEENDHGHVLALKSATDRAKIAKCTRDLELRIYLARDSSAMVRRAATLQFEFPEDIYRELAGDNDLQVRINLFKSYIRCFPDCIAEDLFNEHALNETYEMINRIVNDLEGEEYSDIGKETAAKKNQEEMCVLVVQHTNNALVQRRIIKNLPDKPEIFSTAKKLFDALIENKHLDLAVIRRLAIEHGIGAGTIALNCQNPEIIHEILSRLDTPHGSRTRKQIEEHLLLLQKQEGSTRNPEL
jgi:hypothetical protein